MRCRCDEIFLGTPQTISDIDPIERKEDAELAMPSSADSDDHIQYVVKLRAIEDYSVSRNRIDRK